MTDNWLALESNPEVINEYVKTLGFIAEEFEFCDLFSTDDWAKEMIKKPVLGMMLIYPITQKMRDHKKEEEKKILENGQVTDDQLFFMKQVGENSCGTVALFHILSNLTGDYEKLLSEDSIVRKFKKNSSQLTPQEKGNSFVNKEEIKDAHKEAVQKGETNVIEDVDKHFIAFVHFGGNLYELDGTKKFPIHHGPTNEESFLDDSAKVAKEFMERDPDNIEFGIIVLAKK